VTVLGIVCGSVVRPVPGGSAVDCSVVGGGLVGLLCADDEVESGNGSVTVTIWVKVTVVDSVVPAGPGHSSTARDTEPNTGVT